MTRPTAPVARRQVSVHELIQRVRAENSPPPVTADRVEHRVRTSVALEKGLPHPDRMMRWLVAGAGVVTALSAFALISLVVQDDPATPVRAPELPGPITFAGTRTVTETADPPGTVFYPPYGSQYGSYYVPSK